jgi:hypothetical protein
MIAKRRAIFPRRKAIIVPAVPTIAAFAAAHA